MKVFEAGAAVNSVQWNPNQALTLLAVSYGSRLVALSHFVPVH